jgi:large subunit ribosomal protein L23
MRTQQVISRPLITEKTATLRESDHVVAFAVDQRANKIEIKRAVEAQFPGVKVADVRVARMHGKTRRMGRNMGRRPDWKKAYVRLTEDSKPIEFFEGV